MSPKGVYDASAQKRHLSPLLYHVNQGEVGPGQTACEQLAAMGIEPSDIDYVLLSHLDCDHASALREFAAAHHILIAREELSMTRKKHPVIRTRFQKSWWDGVPYEAFDFAHTEVGPTGRSLDLFGDGSIELVNIPGHSDGLFATMVRGQDGRFVNLVSDGGYGKLVLVRNENLTTEELIASLEADPRVAFAEPNGILQDVDTEENAIREAVGTAKGEITKDLNALDKNALTGEDPNNGSSNMGNAATSENTASSSGVTSPNSTSGSNSDNNSDPIDENADSANGDSEKAITWGKDKATDTATNLNDFVWGFDNDGRMGNTDDDTAVDMRYEAWKTANSNTSSGTDNLEEVVVAVVDTGIDESNPDLEPQLWSGGSIPELESIPGSDEHGFAMNANPEKGITSTTGITSYHGTHVAGIIGAAWDGSGISGLAPNVKLMSVRHNDTLASFISCFNYVTAAADAGVNVRVANNSWGLGQGQWRSIDLAVTECGKSGVASIFASGNSSHDNDTATDTTTGMADNPYVITVDSIDPTGEPSSFTQYGLTTTDVMAPGSTFLSTYGAESQNYLGEEDAEAVLYESFDDKSRRSQEITDAPNVLTGNGVEISEAAKRFDGKASLTISYDPELIENESKANAATILEADLSAVTEKPRYLSMRYTAYSNSAQVIPVAISRIQATNGEWITLTTEKGGFGLGGDSWHGSFVDLQAAEKAAVGQDGTPLEIDWKNFKLSVVYLVYAFSMTGGEQVLGAPTASTIAIDSIGLGSDLVPYAYTQGTSMAAPAVTGAAAVISGQGKAEVANNPAKTAEKLAALVRGAAEPRETYENLCSTQGFATVAGAANPGPAITAVVDEGDTVLIEGYFLNDNTAITLEGIKADITEYNDLGDDKAALTVQKPSDFAGGQVVVRAADGKTAKTSHFRATLGERINTAYYDEKDLPVPSELDTWGSWQLVGFAGNVYCALRSSIFDTEQTYDHMLRYDPNARTWESVALPLNLLANAGQSADIIDVSAATHQGQLFVQLSHGNGALSFARYATDGTWTLESEEPITGVMFPTLASDGESVFLFGGLCAGENGTTDSSSIFRMDFESEEIEQAGSMATASIRPQVSYGNDAFVVSGGVRLSTQDGGVAGVQIVRSNEEGMLAGSLLDTNELVNEAGQIAYASGAVTKGFMIADPESADGMADTYLAEDGGLKPLEAYGKRVSEQMLLNPAATAYEGRFYVLAGTQNAPYRVFSATSVDTLPQPGDYVAPEPEPEPTDPGNDPSSEQESEANSGKDESSELAETSDSLPMPLIAVAITAAIAAAASITAAATRRKNTSTRMNSEG